jgi:hypothetical protein
MLNLIINNIKCCIFTTLNTFKRPVLALFLIFLLSSCSYIQDKEQARPKKVPELNALERARNYEGGGVIFGKAEKDKLGTNNIMWQATMKVLDFVPISSASYNGGVIITDWYTGNSSKESIKIQVTFLNQKIETNSIEVKSYKRDCDNTNSCKTSLTSDEFNKKIKNRIFQEIRKLKVKESTKK